MFKYLNNYFKIFFNDSIIAAGKCISYKHENAKNNNNWPANCISFDDKYFFNTSSQKLKIQESNTCQYFLKDISDLKKILKITKWSKAGLHFNYDVFIENTAFELDPQIQPLVLALNKLDNIYTVGSCCGHNKIKPYVDIRFQSLNALKILLVILEHKSFKHNFTLSSSSTIINSASDFVVLKLQSTFIGEKGYNNIIQLAEYLNVFTNN